MYDRNYCICKRLKIPNTETAWKDNPFLVSSVYPSDLQTIDTGRVKETINTICRSFGISMAVVDFAEGKVWIDKNHARKFSLDLRADRVRFMGKNRKF